MRKFSILILLFVSGSGALFAQTPDWSTKIAGIIYNNCAICHHEGAIAPFPLMTYDSVAWYAFQIAPAVTSRKMPPWPADPDYNHFWGEKVLADSDIVAINDWVYGGTPLGDTTAAPDPPVFTAGTTLTEVDDTLTLPPYTITTDLDDYRAFVIHSDYATTKYIQELDFVPGDPTAVHHVIYFQDTSSMSWDLDQSTPEPGIPGAGSQSGTSPYCVTISGWNPGRDPIKFPPNMGFVIPAGADYVISIHYAPGSLGKIDSSKMYVKFCDLPDSMIRPVSVERYLYWNPPSLLDGPLIIPANTVKTFHEISDTFTEVKTLMGLAPHCHLIGKSWEVVMVTEPEDTTKLLLIPQWYFNWQMTYFLTKMMKIPVGARFFATAVYDNTVNNEFNPSNPPENVHVGESTLDEMMAVRFYVLDYVEGDENYILDSAFYGLPVWDGGGIGASIHDADLEIEVFPNPANHSFHFVTWLPEHEVDWELTNQVGMIVKSGHEKNVYKGIYDKEIDISQFPPGVFYLSIKSGNQKAVKKVIVMN